jgi:hypothetical protein
MGAFKIVSMKLKHKLRIAQNMNISNLDGNSFRKRSLRGIINVEKWVAERTRSIVS